MKSEEFEYLKKEIEQLKKEIKSSKSNINSRSYSSFGSSDSDFLIKTKGKVKIQWGSKFIDLIKDGQINVNSKFIYQTDKVGSKDGIYVVGDQKEIVLVVNGNSIDLQGQNGNTYISFQDEQTLTADEKYLALKNIGFIYNSISDLKESAVKNGIVYIESEAKLYTIVNGTILEFSVSFPNPYTQQFIIAKDDSQLGALLIKGQGVHNSIAFDDSYIYDDNYQLYLDSSDGLCIRVNDNDKIKITDGQVIFSDKIVTDYIQSTNANSDKGYRLYAQNGQSTLEVDNIVVRNYNSTTPNSLYQITWNYNNNIISSIESGSDQTYIISLKYLNTFSVGSELYVYIDTSNESKYNSLYLLPLKVTEINGQSIVVSIINDYVDSNIKDNIQSYISLVTSQTIFEIGNSNKIILTRQSNKGIDIIESSGASDENSLSNIKARIGDLSELSLKGKSNGVETSITGPGVYSESGVFKKIQCTSDYNLPSTDNSTNLATTEWVHKLLPAGSIIMFNGESDIPDGWAICDGNNGTPNLIGKFIKADTTSGTEGGQSSIQLSVENLPSHTHTISPSQINTSTDGLHSHTYTQLQYGEGDLLNAVEVESTVQNVQQQTSENGEHSHTIDLSTVSINSTGEGKPLEWEPTFYSLIFIMKLPTLN